MIKGVRIGPEYKHLPREQQEPLLDSIRTKVSSDTNFFSSRLSQVVKRLVYNTSLGEKESSIATLDLLYYLAGKEGKNPFQLDELYSEFEECKKTLSEKFGNWTWGTCDYSCTCC